jgi:hypothetical protein
MRVHIKLEDRQVVSWSVFGSVFTAASLLPKLEAATTILPREDAFYTDFRCPVEHNFETSSLNVGRALSREIKRRSRSQESRDILGPSEGGIR